MVSHREVENESLKALFADPEWKRRGPTVVLHPEGGRDRRQGPRAGPVGGRIVAEVLVGLLQKDPNSYLYLQPAGSPRPHRAGRGQFTMADLLKFAEVWS